MFRNGFLALEVLKGLGVVHGLYLARGRGPFFQSKPSTWTNFNGGVV